MIAAHSGNAAAEPVVLFEFVAVCQAYNFLDAAFRRRRLCLNGSRKAFMRGIAEYHTGGSPCTLRTMSSARRSKFSDASGVRNAACGDSVTLSSFANG